MLFKLSVSNIRKSLRDYAIYFFTLIIGVSVFYVFNAIGTQTAFLTLDGDSRNIAELLTTMLSGVSVFVAVVLGLLIVYASRFLMKRRNREFALYLTLGMSKGEISSILLIETILIGLGSLFVGLIVGIGLSQLMSAVVVTLFEADMTAYQFTVSGDAIMKTILYFAVMYLVVMVFNSMVISRFRLIDLMQSGRKSEKIKLKNPILCVLVFILAAIALGLAYYQVGWQYNKLTQVKLLACIAAGAGATFLIFWSVSGLLLRMMMSAKNVYYRGLNSFTFRQISSKVNTMVFSMTVICLMLFVTICTLTASFSIRNSMNANLNKLCPADVELYVTASEPLDDLDITKLCTEQDFDVLSYLDDSVHFGLYHDDSFTFADFCGSEIDRISEEYEFLIVDTPEDVIRLSDYNKLMELYGKEQLSLKDDEFILLGSYQYMVGIRNSILENVNEITVFGETLKSKYNECQDGFIDLAAQSLNAGLFVVPDSVVDGQFATSDYLIGNYAANSKEEKKAIENEFRDEWNNKIESSFADLTIQETGLKMSLNTKIDIASAAISLGAIVTFLGLYIGLVFLIACGAILALKELSESVDSIGRYEMLRKIGAEESDLSKSLFRQTGIFFLLPLLLACIHSIFGMKFAVLVLETFGTEKMMSSIFTTVIVVLLIYGGYFLITYLCSKGIIRDRK
jgi:putative ABC transport system permease protein